MYDTHFSNKSYQKDLVESTFLFKNECILNTPILGIEANQQLKLFWD